MITINYQGACDDFQFNNLLITIKQIKFTFKNNKIYIISYLKLLKDNNQKKYMCSMYTIYTTIINKSNFYKYLNTNINSAARFKVISNHGTTPILKIR